MAEAHTRADRPRCNSPLRNKPGQFCRSDKLIGETGRCKLHGGKSPHGPAHPSWKHGRYSKLIPKKLRGDYELAANDTFLLHLHDDIALHQARIDNRIKQLASGETAVLWKQLRAEVQKLEKFRDEGDMGNATESMENILDMVKRGAREIDNWYEVDRLTDRKQRLIESERQRLVQEKHVILVDQAMQYFTTVTSEIRVLVLAYVDDPERQRAILMGVSNAIGRLIGVEAGERLGPGDAAPAAALGVSSNGHGGGLPQLGEAPPQDEPE